MGYSIREYGRKALEKYKQSGMRQLLSNGVTYLTRPLLYHPYVPPISLRYKDVEFGIGYRSTYLHLSGPSFRGVDVVPQPSDIVVEAGVHEGRDTAMFAKMADYVIGFEPSPRNYAAAQNNLRRFSNVKLINEGLWNEESQLEVQYGEMTGDDGFLQTDSKKVGEGGTVPVNTLEHYMNTLDIDNVDFLKVEAEGAEPEILEGMGDLRPKKIVVNGAAERDGEPTAPDVIAELKPLGYNLEGVTYGRNLFFTLDSQSSGAVISAFD
jgi:FkbM family methyltransferase